MDTPQLPDKSESVELFEVKWLSDAQRQRYGGPQALHTLCLSDTDMELLQMGLKSLIGGNEVLIREIGRLRPSTIFKDKDLEVIDIAPVFEGTSADAQELLTRLTMLADRNLAENGW